MSQFALVLIAGAFGATPARHRLSSDEGAARRGSPFFRLDATDTHEFYHQVWQFHNADSALGGGHSEWVAPTVAQSSLLRHEDNYPMLLEGFCRDIPLHNLPNTEGYLAPKSNGWWFTQQDSRGCPLRDAGFPQSNESVLLASGTNCPAPKHCIPTKWLAELEQVFLDNATHVTKDDLFERDVCNIPHVEKRKGQVLPYMYYRLGLQVDFLVGRGHLTSGHDTMLEIGAGWAGVASIVKKKYPGTRYIIVDIPTSMPMQMSHLHHLGHTHIYALSDSATTSDVEQLLCCTPLDVLFLLPHQLPLLPNRSVDVAVNFDSFIEMPPHTIRYYISQLGRISQALFTVNRKMQNFHVLHNEVMGLTRRGAGFKLVHEGMQPAHPSPHFLSAAIGISNDYVQHYLAAPAVSSPASFAGNSRALPPVSSSLATSPLDDRKRTRSSLQLSLFLEEEVFPTLTPEKRARLDELLKASHP